MALKAKFHVLIFALALASPPISLAAFAPSQERRPSNGMIIRQKSSSLSMASFSTENLSQPTPELDGLQVVTICMDALQMKPANEALEICFDFSSDRCRAAVGGTLEQFVQYADNPVFGTLINCDSYKVLSVGPIIPGSSNGLGSRRGKMQTFLVEIAKGMTMKTVIKEAEQRARKRPTLEERLRQRESKARGEVAEGVVVGSEPLDDGKRRFLWTLQEERRPPRQDCWLVHEVLFTKNAIQQTY